MAGFLLKADPMRAQRRLTIMHMAAPAATGGLESVLLELAGGIARSGQRAVLAFVLPELDADPEVVRGAEKLGLDVARVSAPSRAYVRKFRGLRQAIRTYRPDVVHTHGYLADLFGGAAARKAGVPWVATAHGFIGGDRKWRFYEWLQVRSFRSANAIVAVSRPIRDLLVQSGVAAKRVVLLPNALSSKLLLTKTEAREQLGIPASGLAIGWVGRLSREKGADLFLDALAGMTDLSWGAWVIGDGPERTALQRQAEKLCLGNRISWLGIVPNAARLIPAFDVFALSSRKEGTPMVLLEAAAAQVPIVATAVGGVPDMFPDAEVSLVPPEDPAELGKALRLVIGDLAAAAQRSQAARSVLRARFSAGPWLQTHLDLYARLARQTGIEDD